MVFKEELSLQEQLEKRLGELRAEYESGRKMLAELEVKESDLRSTMLRINGAIQVLEEMLAKSDKTETAVPELEKQPEDIAGDS